MLSVLQRPDLLSQTSGEKAAYCDWIHKIIRLLLSVFQIINQNDHIFVLIAEFHEKLIVRSF